MPWNCSGHRTSSTERRGVEQRMRDAVWQRPFELRSPVQSNDEQVGLVRQPW